MKRILFSIAYCLVLGYNVSAQIKNDSLCLKDVKYDNHRQTPNVRSLYFCTTRDSIKPLNTVYLDDGGEVFHGWYDFWYQENFDSGKPKLAGVYPNNSLGVYIAKRNSYNSYIVDIYACFKKGVPCCDWFYKYTWEKDSVNICLLKTETYENGLLHGKFGASTGKKYKDGTILEEYVDIYDTLFDRGTGFYKDFFPDGTLQLEGPLIEGRRNGTWKYYVYSDSIIKMIFETYDKGELISIRTYYGEEIMEKAILWERQPDKFKNVDPEDYDDPSINPFFW